MHAYFRSSRIYRNPDIVDTGTSGPNLTRRLGLLLCVFPNVCVVQNYDRGRNTLLNLVP